MPPHIRAPRHGTERIAPIPRALVMGEVRELAPSLVKMCTRWDFTVSFAEEQLAADIPVGLARRDEPEHLGLPQAEARSRGMLS